MAGDDEGLLDQAEIEALFNTLEASSPGGAKPDAGGMQGGPSPPTPPPAPQPARELDVQPFSLPELTPSSGQPQAESDIALIADVDLNVRVELGRTRMYIEEVLKLRDGSIIPLEKLAGDPVDVYVNGQLLARGEVLVLNDNFCVRISEIVGDEKGEAVE